MVLGSEDGSEDGREDGRTAIPVLRSRTMTGRAYLAPGWSLPRAVPIRRTASSRSTSPRPSRPSHETHAIASSVTTAGGTSQRRISTASG